MYEKNGSNVPAYLLVVRVEEHCEVEASAPLLDARREAGDVALELAGHGVDLVSVALARLRQLLRRRQQLLRVRVRILQHTHAIITQSNHRRRRIWYQQRMNCQHVGKPSSIYKHHVN